MRWLGAFLIVLLLGNPAMAQQDSQPVLILDSQRLFFETQYGQQIAADLAAQAAELQAENDRIVETLTQEERSLTVRRPNMDVADFRAEAEAFDEKVQEVRRVRDAKNVELQVANAEARDRFEAQVQDIITQVMVERGATVVIEERYAVRWVRAANITDVLIARIDATLGDGSP